jgi:MerC mercury resistance protein
MNSEPLKGPRIWRAERLGAGLSIACAVHCLAAPVLLSLFPLAVAGGTLGPRLESFLVLGSVLISSATLCSGFQRHRRKRVLLLLAAACSLLAAARLAAAEPLEALLVVAGTLCLLVGNLLNRRLCRSCPSCRAAHARNTAAT